MLPRNNVAFIYWEEQVISEETTIDINARNVNLSVYQKLYALKKRGKFSSWSVFLKWLVNNKSLIETFVDEIEKHIIDLREETPPKLRRPAQK